MLIMAFMSYNTHEADTVRGLMAVAKEHGLDLEGEFCQILARIFPSLAAYLPPTKADEVIALYDYLSEKSNPTGEHYDNFDDFWRIFEGVYGTNANHGEK